MRFSFILFFSFCFISHVDSQESKIDSLLSVLRNTNVDTIKLNTYKDIVSLYSTSDLSKAKIYLDTMMNIAKRKKLQKYFFTGVSQQGILEYRRGNFNEGLSIWLRALNHDDIDDFPTQKSNLLHNISTGYKVLQKPDSVVFYMNQAINLNLSLDNDKGLIANYFNISGFYSNIHDNDNSIQFLKKLQKLAITTNDKEALARSYILLANISKREYDFDDAIAQFKKAKELYLNIQPENTTMQISLGYEIISVLSFARKFKDALSELGRLRQKHLEQNPKNEIWFSMDILELICFNNLGDFEKGRNIYDKLIGKEKSSATINDMRLKLALSNYELGTKNTSNQTILRLFDVLENSKSTENLDPKYQALNLISQYKLQNGDFKGAYTYLKKSEVVKDSFNNDKVLKLNLSLKRKFNEEIKEKEVVQLKAEKAEQATLIVQESKKKWQLGGGLVLAVLGLGIFAYYYRRNKKQKDAIEKQKNLVETLQKELHHRIKNNLSFIDLFINLAKSRFTDKAYQTKLQELQNRINSMFVVHQQLFKKKDITSVPAKNYLDTLISNVRQAYTNNKITINNITKSNETLLANTSFPVGLIVNEFVTNSYKHAFEDNQKGNITIDLTSNSQEYHLILKDNGKGLPDDFDIENLESFGMETMQLLTEEYKGIFELDGSEGVHMQITLPKTAA